MLESSISYSCLYVVSIDVTFFLRLYFWCIFESWCSCFILCWLPVPLVFVPPCVLVFKLVSKPQQVYHCCTQVIRNEDPPALPPSLSNSSEVLIHLLFFLLLNFLFLSRKVFVCAPIIPFTCVCSLVCYPLFFVPHSHTQPLVSQIAIAVVWSSLMDLPIILAMSNKISSS